MNRVLWSMSLLLSIALGCVSCTQKEPVIKGNHFQTTYSDLVGSIHAEVEVNGWDLKPGRTLDLSYEMSVIFESLAKDNIRDLVKGVWVVWAGERLFDKNGRYHQMVNALMSTYLTPAGIAIENNQAMIPSRQMGHFYGSPFDFAQYFPFGRNQGADGLHLSGAWTRKLDDTVPPGLYRLTFDIFLDTKTFGPKQWATAPFLRMNNPQIFTNTSFHPKYFTWFTKTLYPKRFLPMIQVGRSQNPRMPWILFPEVRSNGNIGVVANEDQDRFALSSRLRYPSKLIREPGTYDFYPCFISNFPLSANLTDIGGATLAQDEIPHYLNFKDGEVKASVRTPTGDVQDLGTRRFMGKRKGGPKLENGDFSFPFDQWGKYTITLKGWIRDLLGRRIEGGGTYDMWIGRWLTFSSSVKPGTNFSVGSRFPAKVEINPPCPAEFTLTVDYYPFSDRNRKKTFVMQGQANTYGYFFPAEDAEALVFDEPGEYRSEFFATFRSPDGALWFGDQISAGIIEGPESRVALHGMRSSDLGLLDQRKENFGMMDRFELNDESSMGVNPMDVADCYDVMTPFHSGDVLYISATYSHFGNVDSYMSLQPLDVSLRRDILDAFEVSPLLTLFPTKSNMERFDKMLRINMLLDVSYIMRDDDKADMFPILFQNRDGYHPFNFPESNEVEAYTYFSSLRPGFTAFVMTSDCTPIGSYWSTSPNIYGNQFNAGVNGDMPSDIYRTTAGLVYKDLKNGSVDYASYASTIVVCPKEMNNNRVLAPCTEPLFTMNGKKQWIGLAMAINEVLEVGDRISLGSLIFPAVPAEIEASLTWPDGRVERVEGTASRTGVFTKGIFKVDVPGVYKVKALATYKGKTGDAFGSGDGIFNHYVVETEHPDILHVGLPPMSRYDVTRILEIPVRIQKGYHEPKITYSVVCPGIIMDEGEFFPRNSEHIFRFIPSQFAMQFPNFDITDFRYGKAMLNDSVFFIFFVEAISPEGKKVFDVKKVMIRDRMIHYFNPATWKGERYRRSDAEHPDV